VVASVTAMAEEGIIEHARQLGEDVLGPGLREIAERHPSVGEVRGVGVFWCVELVTSRETREPLVPFNAAGPAAAPMKEVVAACVERGVVPFAAGNRLNVVPPVNTSVADVEAGLALIDEALKTADTHVTA
jgi:taurine--2-oxoglutarate transaminase